jgi:hypothetical protein
MHWIGNARHGVHLPHERLASPPLGGRLRRAGPRILLSGLSVLGVAGTAAGQAVWTGASGGGMMAVQEAQVLEPSHFAIGLVADNYDRDPLGVDAFDVRVDWRLAVVHRLEMYGRYHISRSVSVPGSLPVPSPPLDLVSLDAESTPRPPYRAMYWPMPYLSHHPTRVGDLLPGEYAFGLKAQLACQSGWRPAMAASAEVSVPGDLSSSALREGSGSGSTDLRLSAAATWKSRRLSVSVNAGYAHNGDLSRGDRLIVHDHAGDTRASEQPIRRPGYLEGGLGLRIRVWRGLFALGEVQGWAPVGARTPLFDEAGASDVLAGIQVAIKGVALTVGVRQHLAPPADGVGLPTGPLAGALDLSAMADAAQRRYLASLGVDERYHRPGAGLVVVGAPPGSPDPEGSRRIPGTYLTHTTGNDGLVAAVSLSF